MIAPSRDKGIAVIEMNAVLTSARKKKRTTVTRTAPINNDDWILPMAVSTKLAGRNSFGWMVIPEDRAAGCISTSAASTARVTSSVFAPYWLETTSTAPGTP